MKIKLASIIALTMTVMATTASMAQAQVPTMPNSVPFPPVLMQPGQNPPEIPGLNLTDEQKNQVKEIHEKTRSELEGILTSEQKNKLKEAAQAGKNPIAALQSLNLSDEQKTKLREVMESTRAQMDSILTDEQREKFSEFREKMPNPPFGKSPFPN